jgi:hypothetical protein
MLTCRSHIATHYALRTSKVLIDLKFIAARIPFRFLGRKRHWVGAVGPDGLGHLIVPRAHIRAY